LTEIAETSGKSVMNVTAGVLQKLLAALNECTEWVSECSENVYFKF
jgi:AP-1 complex subunit beta-1